MESNEQIGKIVLTVGEQSWAGSGTLAASCSTAAHSQKPYGGFMSSVQTPKTNHNDFERSPEAAADFIKRVRLNQQKLTAELKPHYDFIVCGSGSSGSLVARRLA